MKRAMRAGDFSSRKNQEKSSQGTAFFLVGISSTVLFSGLMKDMLENKMVMYLGKISYGIYVYHLLILSEFGKYFDKFWNNHYIKVLPLDSLTAYLFKFVFITVSTITAAIISYELIEKNILKLN